MTNLKNLEIIKIFTTDEGELWALMSYQNPDEIPGSLNNGYDTIHVPINIRPIQLSSHGNMLVDQSVKNYSEVQAK